MSILPGFLDLAVPLEMQRMSNLDPSTLSRVARDARETVAAKGDVIQFRAPGTAAATAALIRALAALALTAEGGVTFDGHHWCRDHSTCLEAS